MIQVVYKPEQLQVFQKCSFVPTMGALHEGHLALIRHAAELGHPVVVSIFVNPTQFGPGEDYQSYPRQVDQDIESAQSAGADVVFVPDLESMYPSSQEIKPPPLPMVATRPGLEDAHRPHHFAGVCQVVARLFDLVNPKFAIFGEKDYQQLLVIRAMVDHEGLRWRGLKIVGHPTIREPDGLAMSSRNAYLDRDQRERALEISRVLRAVCLDPIRWFRRVFQPAFRNPDIQIPEIEQLLCDRLESRGLDVEYAVIRNDITLMPVNHIEGSYRGRVLIAARVDEVRLIDNVVIES